MSVTIEWDDDSYRILCVTLTNNWSPQQLYEMAQERFPQLLLNTTTVPSMIVDFTQSGTMSPDGILKLWQEAFGWLQTLGLSSMLIVLVHAPPIIRSAGGTLRNLRVPVMRYTFFVDTIEEAHSLIRSHRDETPPQSLPPSQT